MVQPMWTIKATLELQDTNGKRLDDQSALKYMDVFLKPDLRKKEGDAYSYDHEHPFLSS
jgi:hypothetical protein